MTKTEAIKKMRRGKGWIIESPGGKKANAELVKKTRYKGDRIAIFKIEADQQ